MVQINQREYYPHIHEDRFVEVSVDVAELFLVYRRSEASYARKARRYWEIPVCTLKTAYTVLQVQSIAQRSEKRGGATMVHTGAIHASRWTYNGK